MRGVGIEPTRIATRVLKTLSLTTRTSSRLSRECDPCFDFRQSSDILASFAFLGALPHLGIEPKTYTLQRSCSTTELKRLWPYGLHRMGLEPMRLSPAVLETASLTTRTSV